MFLIPHTTLIILIFNGLSKVINNKNNHLKIYALKPPKQPFKTPFILPIFYHPNQPKAAKIAYKLIILPFIFGLTFFFIPLHHLEFSFAQGFQVSLMVIQVSLKLILGDICFLMKPFYLHWCITIVIWNLAADCLYVLFMFFHRVVRVKFWCRRHIFLHTTHIETTSPLPIRVPWGSDFRIQFGGW